MFGSGEAPFVGVSSNPESVLLSCDLLLCFWLQTCVALGVCPAVAAPRPGWAGLGLLWFKWSAGFGEASLVLKSWQEHRRYWLDWQCAWLMTAVCTGGHVGCGTLKRFVCGCYLNADHLPSSNLL